MVGRSKPFHCRVARGALALPAVLMLALGSAESQEIAWEDSLPPIRSLGLPHAFRPYAGIGAGLTDRGPGTGALLRGMVGVYRDITNPFPGFAGFAVEGWAGTERGRFDQGGRLMFASHAGGFQAGFDYSRRVNRVQFVLTASQSFRRGGLLLPGATARLDWVPGRGSLIASLSVPLAQPGMGRTRPRRVDVEPAESPEARPPPVAPIRPALRQSLDRVRESALWIAQLVVPFLPPGPPERALHHDSLLAARLSPREPDFPATHTVAGEVGLYHALLRRAFDLAMDAADAPPARSVSDTARRILLDELLIPFDRDLGRIRRPAVLGALRNRAAAAFAHWVEGSALVPVARRQEVIAVFQSLLATVQEAADTAQARWGDSRLIWLPLQYALEPDDHDEQSELDRILERIMDQRFQPGHDIDYATDERFHPTLVRSILEAREYHVLWIHDFAGRNPDGRPDSVAQQVVLNGYLAALRAAADAFDRTRRVPTFLILLDGYYYRRSRADRWLEVLQDPLGVKFRLRAPFRDVELAVRAAQDSLRAAVAGSALLREAERKRGRRWLRRLFAVHVSVLNPPDASFRGPALGRGYPATITDDVMRDHRKVAFADLTESDPARGVAILTGLGVGEHYARYRWLDRTMVLRGPAAVTLKTEARALLRSQGFSEDEIPRVLRPDRSPGDGVRVLEDSNWSARVAIAMNATGYGSKQVTAAKAALYTLMPGGSTVLASDPEWLNRFWGGMLLGAVLRGCQVVIIAPGPDNAPFEGSTTQMILQRELLLRLVQARAILRAPIAVSGGRLEVGLFRIGLGTYNVPGAVRAIREELRRYPFVRELLPFHRGVWDLFEQADSLLLALGHTDHADTSAFYHPRFHLKTQFFASAEAMREAIGRPEWREFFARRIRERLDELPGGTDITLGALSPLRPYLGGRSPRERERQILYLTVGSHNQDSRSLVLDGEALCLVAGEDALVSAGDMLLLSTVGTEWLSEPADLDRSFPPRDYGHTTAARALEDAF